MRSAAVQSQPSTTEATFLVATDRGDNPASAMILETALQLAREADARVVLYDRSAESVFNDPFEAAAWAGGQIPTWEQLLTAPQLERLGYGYLAEQLTYAKSMGLEAMAWLPFGSGPVAMARCCAAWGVTDVVLPAAVVHPSWRARLRGHTLAGFQFHLRGVELLLVDTDARVPQIETAGNPQPARTRALV
jgi:hypothetical protein